MGNIIGQRFGRWTVVAHDRIVKKNRRVIARCDCGTERPVFLSGLRSGGSTSCGCYSKEVAAAFCAKRNHRHGGSGTREYRIYKNIMSRCFNRNVPSYPRYGGRGVTVCKRWLGGDGFANFLADMGPAPSPLHTVERKNGDKGYAPGNCRWATRAEQSRNTCRSRMLTHNGETLCLRDWARRYKMGVYAFMSRVIFDGWPE